MALVLPATTLRVESMRGIREMMATKYDVDYIITTDYRSAFSESTALREILLIARKRDTGDTRDPCIIANLKVLPSGENIPNLEKFLMKAKSIDKESVESDLCQIYRVEQGRFVEMVEDWSVLLPSEQTLDELIEAFNSLENVCFLRDLVKPKDVKRCDYPSIMYVAWERDARTREKGNILKEMSNGLLSRSKLTGSEITIPYSATLNGLWALSGLETLDITDREDKIISRSFPDFEHYFGRDVSDVFKKWGVKKLLRYTSDFFVPRKIDLSASGTRHLAVRTENPTVPSTSIWGLGNLGEKGKLLALFMHSSLGIALLLRKRIEVRGAWSQFSKETLLSLPVPNFDSFDDERKKDLINVYNNMKNKPFPSLIEQFNTSFDGLMDIDKAIFSALGLEECENERMIRQIHLALAKELEHFKEMMARD